MRRRPLPTLRGRLLVAFLSTVVVGFVAMYVLTCNVLERILDDRLDDQLHVMNNIQEAALGPGAVDPPTGFTASGGGWALLTIRHDGTVRWRYGHEAAVFPVPAPNVLRQAAAAGPVDVAGRYRMVVTDHPQAGYLVTAYALKDRSRLVGLFMTGQAVISVVVVVLIALVASRASRRVLRPLESLTRTARTIAGDEFSHRFRIEGSSLEVARLELAFNVMLRRIEDAFARRRRAEEQLRRFVADAGHELRTPLTTITGYVQLFGLGALDDCDAQAEAVRRVGEEARRMTALVEELLLLARLDEGRPPEDRGPVDLGGLCTDAVTGARVAAPQRELAYSREPGVHLVHGSEQGLYQVVSNLLANVRTHTPAGTTARLRLSRDGRDVLIDVIDNGPGVPTELWERVFDRFFAVTAPGTARTGPAPAAAAGSA